MWEVDQWPQWAKSLFVIGLFAAAIVIRRWVDRFGRSIYRYRIYRRAATGQEE